LFFGGPSASPLKRVDRALSLMQNLCQFVFFVLCVSGNINEEGVWPNVGGLILLFNK
jgi:ferric iron reductase protein FhuF